MKKTILIVDDELSILKSIKGIFLDEGFDVLTAKNGEEALTIIESEQPELVFLDIWLPGIDGIEVLKKIKSKFPHIQVVIMSGHSTIGTAVHALKLGASDFLEKPFSLDNLLHIAKNIHESIVLVTGKEDKEEAVRVTGVGEVLEERYQNTLKESVVLGGRGLHSGLKTGLILSPLPPGSGIIFGNISTGEMIPAHHNYVESTEYATSLRKGNATIRTIEHLLAALSAYRVNNCMVKINEEVPIMDGSALAFCQLIEEAGVIEQDVLEEEIVVRERYEIGEVTPDTKYMIVEPANRLSIVYTLHYPQPIGRQKYSFVLKDSNAFKSKIAPARTFGFLKDIEKLEKIGLANGGRLDNCILIDDEKVINTELRFSDEFVRHKILDLIGDLYLLGRQVRARIIANMTGHSDNYNLVKMIWEKELNKASL
ncbi:MAG: UDP-3-O-acyl-N-acetylglucosamine deacetylase [Thermodesulfobacteriota bacterium]|nr:UDP-3-O-acyl-N-acetylglucosamine deacetylase [Thermodesulfobacteriota bacterium]